MNYYDQHLHTFLSFDSQEIFENYLLNKPAYFVATDHLDLHNPGDDFHDDIPDYEKLTQKLAELAPNYPTTFLKGVEIGVVPGQEDQINDYLNQHPYDLKLLSIHQNGKFDYMDDVVLTKDKFDVAKKYFDQMSQVLDTFPDAQILTHFDYGLRRLDFTPQELEKHFEKELSLILKKVIKREMALEINAKSFGYYQNANLYRYVIPLYKSLGGKFFTLGSDAHQAEDYQALFPEMAGLLKEFGVNFLVTFQKNDRFLTELPE
ncbi:MAG: PHP domain-containing protein [Tetragenococcus sp.]|nr:PHP domain-containing protein [Tetragenococcus sp.]